MTREKRIEWSVLTACLVLGFAASCMSGCITVHSEFKETSIDENGNPIETKYEGRAIGWGPGSKMDPSTHAMKMSMNEDGTYTLDVGQTSEGGSVEGVGAAVAGLQGMLDYLAASIAPAP